MTARYTSSSDYVAAIQRRERRAAELDRERREKITVWQSNAGCLYGMTCVYATHPDGANAPHPLSAWHWSDRWQHWSIYVSTDQAKIAIRQIKKMLQ